MRSSIGEVNLGKFNGMSVIWNMENSANSHVALIGGSVGSIIGMHLFRHKTKHWYFLYGMPLILVLHIICAYFILNGPIEFFVI